MTISIVIGVIAGTMIARLIIAYFRMPPRPYDPAALERLMSAVDREVKKAAKDDR